MAYKILVPKPAASNSHGTETKLYEAGELVDAKEDWQKSIMDSFVQNGWAIETKDVQTENEVEEGEVEPVESEPKRARNDQGHYVADDPTTPDVNEAYEGGEAPKKKRTYKKRTTKKKDS